jgi:hypothetical protein
LLEALPQIEPGKGFSVRRKTLVCEHGRAIGIGGKFISAHRAATPAEPR